MEDLLNKIHLMDNMELMAQLPDKSIDLAIVDPPYGILNKFFRGGGRNTKNKTKFHILYAEKQWDKKQPKRKYWIELFRVSKNQIICGANYFVKRLPISRGWIVWDKQGAKMSSVNDELLFTSFDISIKTFSRCHGLDKGFMNKEGGNIHPTQKPVALYRWLLTNYAKQGNIILDTHCGSASSVIACIEEGYQYIACENDPDYHKDSLKRIQPYLDQGKLF